MITCDLCNKEFPSWSNLGMHISKDHRLTRERHGNRIFCICWCGKWFDLKTWDYTHAATGSPMSNFGFHLWLMGGVGTHYLEHALGVMEKS